MIETAFYYEHLMRFTHKCGRDYAKGADADIFRAYEKAYALKNEKRLSETFTIVWTNLQEAFLKIQSDYNDDISVVNAIRECKEIMATPNPETMRMALIKALDAVEKYK